MWRSEVGVRVTTSVPSNVWRYIILGGYIYLSMSVFHSSRLNFWCAYIETFQDMKVKRCFSYAKCWDLSLGVLNVDKCSFKVRVFVILEIDGLLDMPCKSYRPIYSNSQITRWPAERWHIEWGILNCLLGFPWTLCLLFLFEGTDCCMRG